MIKRSSIFSILLICLGTGIPCTAEQGIKTLECNSFCDSNYIGLQNLYNRYFEELQADSPEFATYIGTTKYNDQWTDYSEEGYARRQQKIKYFRDCLLAYNRDRLSQEDQINYDLLLQMLDESLEDYRLKLRYLPVDQLSGVPLDVENIILMMPMDCYADYLNILERLKKLPTLLDQIQALLVQGLDEGITHPQICLRSLPMRLKNLVPDSIQESPFFLPFIQMPETMNVAKADFLRDEAQEILTNQVYPAYNRLLAYVTDVYLPNCRTTTGMCDMPNGKELYNFCVQANTTTKMTPSQIHALGLQEVSRIRAEMQDIVNELGFEGSREDFMHELHTNPSFFYQDAKDLVDGYRDITNYIDAQLPTIFGKLPILPYEVVPVPAHSEQSQVGAYYMPGSFRTGRPGRFYANTFDLASRPKWAMESLALHEAVPGHHFQISIAQEMENVPEFRKYTRYVAYVEGWALYCEGLGQELGLYVSPYSRYGRLVEEIWRAVRLVVDTGMHALGWTREQAIAYFMEQTGSGKREATTEIDRYLVWPGQALAYKVGELSIKRWRHMAEKELGQDFDIRKFHDELLARGALPMGLCEKLMKEWIASQLYTIQQAQ